MIRRMFHRLALVSLALVVSGGGTVLSAAPTKPNIVIILTDDMGWSDLGCYGGEIQTPNLDALAKSGVRFCQFYNTARCCPTRASLLTGLYPHQAGVGHMMEDKGYDAYRGDLNRRSVTIAEVLRPAGYRTYAVGKWHVTPGATAAALERRHNWPRQRGFDRYYGTIHGAGSFWDPSALVRDDRLITAFSDPEYRPAEYYYTDAISDQAVRFIREHGQRDEAKPFFLYVAFTAAHWPMHAKDADIAKYRGKYDAGYSPVRTARWARLRELGLADSRWQLPPLDGDWAGVKDQAFEARCMEVYAAMVDCMDQGVGRIVAELKAQGMFDNTLLAYLQDNGGCAENNGRNGPFVARGDQPGLPPMANGDFQYGSAPKQTRDGYPVRQGYGVMPGSADTYIAYGRAWANVSNTPFRYYKHWEHEGGIATPLIVHWPAGLAGAGQGSALRNTPQGRLCDQPGHLVDLMATCVDAADASYPAEVSGQPIQPMEGVSLLPALTGQPWKRAVPIFWEHEGNRAVRDGKWKLVSAHRGREAGPWELYDLETDRTEMVDLAASESPVAARLSSAWDAWAERVGVQPWPVKSPEAATAPERRAQRRAMSATTPTSAPAP